MELTIEKLISELQKHPNPKAVINLTLNVINEDLEEYDEQANLEIISQDVPYEDFVDIIVTPKLIKDNADLDNSIHLFLSDSEEDKLKIEIDLNDGIYIFDERGGVLRECEFLNPKRLTREEKIQETVLKLRKML